MTGRVEGKALVEGNQAAALGALMGGASVVAWYPITPSSSLCEYFIAYSDRFRVDPKTGEKLVSVVQAEDELAAVGMAIGAGWAGARAMTSTSGPGISLMAEFSGLAYYAEVPVVIFDIQRIGPSTGLPTRTSQADIGFVYTLSHGDTKHIVLLPGTVEECYELSRDAFDYADRFQTPVFVLSDLDLGMNLWMTPEFKYPDRNFDRGKVLSKDDLDRLAGEWAFAASQARIHVAEQNRDGRLCDLARRALPAGLVGRLPSIRHYNGQPIPAAAIIDPLMDREAVPA